MRFNAEHKMIMRTAFSNYNRLVQIEQDDYLDRLFQVMEKTELKSAFDRGEPDFRDFAIQGYLRNLRNKIDEWQDLLDAVKATRDIVDHGLDDDFDEGA